MFEIGKNVLRDFMGYKLNMKAEGFNITDYVLDNISIPFTTQGVQGTLCVMISDLQIKTHPTNDIVDIILEFESTFHYLNTSLVLDPPALDKAATLLDGNITISVPVELDFNFLQSQLKINTDNPNVSLNFNTGSQNKIQDLISNTGATFQGIITALVPEIINTIDIKNVD